MGANYYPTNSFFISTMSRKYTLDIEDQTFCNQMGVFIHGRIGKSIKEIADSDLSRFD